MNLSKYRVEAGVYDVGEYRIYYAGSKCWQLRCPLDDIVDFFPTLRAAIKYAEHLRGRVKP